MNQIGTKGQISGVYPCCKSTPGLACVPYLACFQETLGITLTIPQSQCIFVFLYYSHFFVQAFLYIPNSCWCFLETENLLIPLTQIPIYIRRSFDFPPKVKISIFSFLNHCDPDQAITKEPLLFLHFSIRIIQINKNGPNL